MKRRELINKLEDMAAFLLDWEERQDWYQNPRTNISEAIPRYRQILHVRAAKGVEHV